MERAFLHKHWQWVNRNLRSVKEELERPYTPQGSEADDGEFEDTASLISTEQASVFDDAATDKTPVSDIGTPLVLLPVVQPVVSVGPTFEQTKKEMLELLDFIAPRVTQEELQELLAHNLFPSDKTLQSINKLKKLSLKKCDATGSMHEYQEDHRGCYQWRFCCHDATLNGFPTLSEERELLRDCRHSLLTHCTHYASANSASIAGNHRHHSLAAQRIANYCGSPECTAEPPDDPETRCKCMETLIRATNAREKEIDGFYHCKSCLVEVMSEIALERHVRVVAFQTEEGRELLAQYVCTCNRAVSTPRRRCKICRGVCKPFTLNPFTTIQGPNDLDRAIMQSALSHRVNGGDEGSDNWNNGDCLWFFDSEQAVTTDDPLFAPSNFELQVVFTIISESASLPHKSLPHKDEDKMDSPSTITPAMWELLDEVAYGVTVYEVQRLVPHLQLALDRVIDPDKYEIGPDVEDAETERSVDSVFSNTDSEDGSVSEVPDLVPQILPIILSAPAPPVGEDGEFILWELEDVISLLYNIAKHSTLGRLQTTYKSANLPSPFKKLMWESSVNLTLQLCEETGLRHGFEEENMCVRCAKQLCGDCRYSLLYHFQLYASNTYATRFGLCRRDSLAALRIHTVCGDPRCKILRPGLKDRCTCMDTLLGERIMRNVKVEGFHHCKQCFDDISSSILKPNTALRTFETKNGEEVLAEYTCACGYPGQTDLPISCKICSSPCCLYTLNDFDVVREEGMLPVTVMRSESKVNGGQEGQRGWNNGECLLFMPKSV
ncbi:hypothetical protein VTL71DRAFT_6953 [Oculimacula yallundae]|uniref:Uncharacterized protein n=1 Tax=Oculimacula yallundae TaxID=86028 RepID=A0ABR4BWS5_9HELO